ncbi:choline dehydrogenase [Sorangium cellulosum]|uniref:Cholesterol oxidase n=1 Tax=Sorangium cellulosum TaxID=56 RepID=A0A2L0F325_SORCE|nr:alpha/beta fold hydrolase [Sorangium cellulosum]AUX45933.1 choline dehydrogenase [Sorangium cellulosum]
MNRLSSPISSIQSHYDVVVVGSGYGGAITASRLSRAGKRVCVLERGKERQPGEFPGTTLEAGEELQIDLPACHRGSRTGLFDLRVNHDISILVGCGLGGTSLINANVSFRPDMRVFDDRRWPAGLREEQGKRLTLGFELAEKMLGANKFPEDQPLPPKAVALKRSAEAMGHRFYTLPINVTFTEGYNHAGVRQKACTLCGDCATGCNHGAKNSVLMNYLPDAKRHGAELFVETSVRWVERGADGAWIVHYQPLRTGRETFDAPTLFVTADIVILAAGALGSTEILMRSRDAGKLTVSGRLGHAFGGNGDMVGFGYNGTPEIRSVGLGQKGLEDSRPPGPERAIGPCITSVIDMRGSSDIQNDMIIEEGVIPGALAQILPATLKAASLGGVNTGPSRIAEQLARETASLIHGPYRGATTHTQTYLGMCHDDSNGLMKLDGDRVRVEWPDIGKAPAFERLHQRLVESTRPFEGIYIANPIWSDILCKSLITVHPLGGCTMADSAEEGVVDHTCKVFSSSVDTAVHEGLYVCDGSIIPTSIGVNPLLTISALAERCCMIMAEERGFSIDYAQKGPIRETAPPRTLGVRFTERMKGWFSHAPDEDYEAAARRGEAQGSSFAFVLTIASEDVDAMISGSGHEARMVGTVAAPTLSASPLVVTQGVFNLFVPEASSGSERRMKYRMVMTAEGGRAYTMFGFKILRDRPFWELWHDSTTLYITIREGAGDDGPVVGRGVLTITPDDFVRLLSTFDVTNARSVGERSAATVRFGRFFAGSLYDRYGGIAAPARSIFSFGEEERPRKRRSLRAPAPALVPVKASDGAIVLLTRYAGGAKGPVILSHGLGSSSAAFSIDTIDTNLVEYLVAAGYDVWLLDDRGSVQLPTAGAAFTADDIARKDWPAAVAAVRAATSAAAVQVVAHDLGAITLAMAMLSGLEGVRSAVCSQAATHLVTAAPGPWQSDAGSPRSSSPRYERARLDDATHAALPEVFGEPSAELLTSASMLVRKGFIVDALGEDVYLPRLERLAIPIRLLHGAENKCFLPASTEQTLEALSAKNGAGLYSREVFAGYGHDDCLLGRDAPADVYPKILEHLEATP